MGESGTGPKVAAAAMVVAHVVSMVGSGAAGTHAATELRRGDRIVVGIVQAYPSVEYGVAPPIIGRAAAAELEARHGSI